MTKEQYESELFEREIYEQELKERQQQHLDSIKFTRNMKWIPCLHDSCNQCVGTGIKQNGSPCVHFLSCPCPKCTPYC